MEGQLKTRTDWLDLWSTRCWKATSDCINRTSQWLRIG